jgi:uncharacterized protein (DUF488 family)
VFSIEYKQPAMFSRQKAILRLIQNDGGVITRLRLVKLAFLLSREPDAPRTGTYDFVPYKRGPFSFTLYHELRVLERDGWILQAEHDIRIAETPDPETAFLDKEFLALIDIVSHRHSSVTTSAVVDGVYRAYPWFTLNSDVAQKRAVKRPEAELAVYTVGYEGIMVDALLDLLLRQGIRRLIDVRCNPIARRYGFHKATICKLCNDVGIEYIHFASLGIPSAWRVNLSDHASYQRLFERYQNEILPRYSGAIDSVGRLVAESPSALMCMEADHHSCHRSRLAAEVAHRTSLQTMELREV